MAKQTDRNDNRQENKSEFKWSDSSEFRPEPRKKRKPEGRRAGSQEGRREDRRAGSQEGRREDRRAGRPEGRYEDRRAGSQEGRREDRRAGSQEDRREDRRAGRPEGRYEDRKPGRMKQGQGDRKFDKSSDKKFDRSENRTGKQGYQKTGKAAQTKKSSKGGVDKCPHAKKCGGCMFQGVSYPEQLTKKQGHVIYLLKEFGKVHDIIGMEDPYHYRNKVHAVFDRTKNGTIISGVYEEKSHRVVAIEECQIENKLADAIIGSIRDMCKSFKIRTYDEDTGYGLLRHVIVRTGHESGQVMVVLVITDPILPSKNNFVKALRKLHPEISTIVLNINDKRTSMVLGERDIVLYGKGYIEDSLCGSVFRISPQSFYQVNPAQTEVLYSKAIEVAGLTGKERVIDAYCGTGTIGIIASKHAKEVIGVELNKNAVRDAITNAKRNDVKNIKFYNQDAGKFMVGMAEEGEQADVVFMDPPRTGCDEAFLSSVVQLSPKKIVYVSCNPETLARDLKYLKKNGYEGKDIWPVDMFPFTGHVEVVTELVKVK